MDDNIKHVYRVVYINYNDNPGQECATRTAAVCFVFVAFKRGRKKARVERANSEHNCSKDST